MSVQKYVHQNNVFWKIVDDPEFIELKAVLHNIMKECAANNIGSVKKQVQYILLDFEKQMW